MQKPNKPPQPELLAPAGSFSSAVHAFRNGADAVYLGLPRFSARKNARNFTMDELARLRSAVPGGKIYVAVNTVIREAETEEFIALLYAARLAGADAVIVQDYGLPPLIRTHFPGLPVHASTQMAVHNAAGVRALQKLGVSRVILARELSVAETRSIRNECPGIELEVFIHGALCYGMSGLCLASGLLLGRSGNRGECAQVCRTWFTRDREKGYPFSTNDLSRETGVKALREIGIASFKIEGRMKPPEYAGTASAYYRAVLDGLPEDLCEERLRAMRTVFSRQPTSAFADSPRGNDLINPAFPGHIGIPAGRVVSVEADGFSMELSEPLSVRDGILFFGGREEPVRMGVTELRRNGRKLFDAEAGDTVRILSPDLPLKNEIIRKTSSHDLTWPEIPSIAWKPAKFPVPVRAILIASALTIEAGLPVPPEAGLEREAAVRLESPVRPEEARNRKDFTGILKGVLGEAGEYPEQAVLSAFENRTTIETESVFIPPSVLKRMRQDFYRLLDETHERLKARVPKAVRDAAVRGTGKETEVREPGHWKGPGAFEVPARSLLVPRGGSVPFVTGPETLEAESLPLHGGARYLPLAPVVFDEAAWFPAVDAFIAAHPETPVMVGLNNASHLDRIEELARHGHVSFFIDYGLYCANILSYLSFVRRVPRLAFLYFWIEGSEDDYRELTDAVRELQDSREPGTLPPVVRIEAGFRPPLFISRICPFRHAWGESCGTCTRNTHPGQETELEQNGKLFRVTTRNCITYVYQSPGTGSGTASSP